MNDQVLLAYTKGDFDLESGSPRKARKLRISRLSSTTMIKSTLSRVRFYFKIHPLMALIGSLLSGLIFLAFLSMLAINFEIGGLGGEVESSSLSYPLAGLRSLVMVAWHSVYTSSSCGKIDGEDSWFLESYQKHQGQAATFVAHIKKGIEMAARDMEALLLFSGGETRRDADPLSEAQSYWTVAESQGWFGKQEVVRWRALTEEHARDSFENLLFSVCRFRELTGRYPHNITVVGYNFKEERFTKLHRLAMGFPVARFFYVGTPASLTSGEAAMKGEAAVRDQFRRDPYGCVGSFHH